MKDLREFAIVEGKAEAAAKSPRYLHSPLVIGSNHYRVLIYDHSLELRLRKFGPRGWHKPVKRACLYNLAYLSSSYANRSKIYLILGNTDDEHMHVLVIPDNREAPELKTIPLTWAAARAILQRKWEDQYGSVGSGVDSDTGSDMDPGERSSEDSDEVSNNNPEEESDEDGDEELDETSDTASDRE